MHHQILKALCLSVLVMLCLGFARPTSAALIACDENAKDSQGQPVSAGTVEENWIRVQVPIPGVTANCQDDQGFVRAYIQDLGAYIAGIYRWFSGAIGVFATVMIFYGGIVWLTAGGNRSRVQSAKEVIFSSLIAVVIALGSYLLLYTISPRLVNLRPPALKVTQRIDQEFVEFIGLCGENVDGVVIGKADTPCGEAYILESGNDNNPPKACMGVKCSTGVLPPTPKVCQINRDSNSKLTSGTCRSEFIGYHPSDTNIQYNFDNVSPNDSCGRYFPLGENYTVGQTCSGDAECVLDGQRIIMENNIGLLTDSGQSQNVMCSNKFEP